MAGVLNWKALKVAQTSGIRVTVAGSVNTRVATRYFWIPDKGKPSANNWTMKDGDPLDFDTQLIKAGLDNRLGFACQMLPVDATNLNMQVTFQVRQGDTILLEQVYSVLTTNPNIQMSLADGISLTV